MIKIVEVKSPWGTEAEEIIRRQAGVPLPVQKLVKKILKDISQKGHSEVIRFARQYDGLKGSLGVSPSEMSAQAAKCSPHLKTAINQAVDNVTRFHEHQTEKSWTTRAADGTVLGQNIRPLQRVGLYVPGGKGIYPSTVIMNAVPARVAGVGEIAAVTPVSGKLDPAMAFAFKKLGITEVYKVGGAQAVAALALGTEKIRKVDKIVGPGNNFVAAAKKEVFGLVDIDMIAGPSEILVMADDTSDPDWVAADMLSQAEHGSGYEAAICVTPSRRTAEYVKICLEQQVASSPKKELLIKCLTRFGRIFVVKDWDAGCILANRLAPEHLELMMAGYEKYQDRITCAGAVFAGPWSPESVGDYFAGPNHVLPTNGTARFFSPLGVYDFYKRSSYIRYSSRAFQRDGRQIISLAEAEGFFHHGESVRKRLE